MRVAIASDHAGFALKEYLKPRVVGMVRQVIDFGCLSDSEPVADYAPVTLAVASELGEGRIDRAIYVCGNGFAMAMLANRIPGVRAAVCHDAFTARTCVEMGGANAISLGARVVGRELAGDLVGIWFAAEFQGGINRYRLRLEAVKAVERRLFGDRWRVRLREYLAEHEAIASAEGQTRVKAKEDK